ncbi:MAG: hypothetical protein CSA81_13800 [Acidobacteria bacterium]|nr:MAG: hypothetical protein CSA81_13800 [Acidobacteriota bacterium]
MRLLQFGVTLLIAGFILPLVHFDRPDSYCPAVGTLATLFKLLAELALPLGAVLIAAEVLLRNLSDRLAIREFKPEKRTVWSGTALIVIGILLKLVSFFGVSALVKLGEASTLIGVALIGASLVIPNLRYIKTEVEFEDCTTSPQECHRLACNGL